eukprot:jgi/Psemu1/30862/gm1.30862_g
MEKFEALTTVSLNHGKYCMPTEKPPDIPIARRTRSHLSLVPTSARDSTSTPANTMAILPAPPPIEQREDLFPSFDQPLTTVLQELFDVPKESNSTLCEALIDSTIQTWSCFLHLRGFDDLTYRDRNKPRQLLRYVHQELHLFVTFGVHLKDQDKDPRDHRLYTKEAFQDYSASALASVKDSTVNRLTTQISPTTSTVLNNDARFEHRLLVKFKAKLESTDINTTTFLDPDCWSSRSLSGYQAELHTKQCAFFWTLLLHVFQSDLSSLCMLSHTSTSDGRQAYFDFVKLHNRSKSKVCDTSIAMQDLLSMDLLSWNDTKVKFITTWFAKLEHLNKLQPPQRPLEYDSVCTHLCKAYNSNYQLNEQFTKIEDPLEAHDLLAFRRNEAKATTSEPNSRPTVKAHIHDFASTEQTYSMVTDDTSYNSPPIHFHGDFQDYVVYCAGRTPDSSTRLPTSVWQTLTKPGMKARLNLPAEDKKKLVACLRPDLLPEQPHDPNLPNPVSQCAYEHSVAPDQTPDDYITTNPSQLSPAAETDARNAFHASLGIYKATSESDTRPFKSSKDGTTYIPVGGPSLSAKFHYWYLPDSHLHEFDSPVSVEPCTQRKLVVTPIRVLLLGLHSKLRRRLPLEALNPTPTFVPPSEHPFGHPFDTAAPSLGNTRPTKQLLRPATFSSSEDPDDHSILQYFDPRPTVSTDPSTKNLLL